MQTTFKSEKLEASIIRLQDLRNRRLDLTVALSKLKFYNKQCIVPGVRLNDGSVVNLNLDLSKTATQQLCSRLNIPFNYLDRLYRPAVTDDISPEESLLLQLGDTNLKTLCAIDDRTAFIRTYVEPSDGSANGKGIVRAVLSDRYFPIENLDIAVQVLTSAKAVADERELRINVDECSLSDDNFYMRFTCPDVKAHATEALKSYHIPDDFNKGGGTGVVTGFIVRNSETGKGQLTVAPMVTVMTCKNRMIWERESHKRRHLGAQMEEGQTWSSDTVHKNSELILSQVKDIIDNILSEDFILQRVNDIEAMHAVKLEHPVEVVRGICKAVSLDDADTQDVLNFFIKQGSSSSAFDVAQALTYYAQGDNVTPEKRYEIEAMSFEMAEISKTFDKAPTAKAKREPETFRNLN